MRVYTVLQFISLCNSWLCLREKTTCEHWLFFFLKCSKINHCFINFKKENGSHCQAWTPAAGFTPALGSSATIVSTLWPWAVSATSTPIYSPSSTMTWQTGLLYGKLIPVSTFQFQHTSIFRLYLFFYLF